MKRAANVKDVLCALCRALSVSGIYWDPEIFRKSKFNRTEATSEFWKLLYYLLKQIYPGEDDLSNETAANETIAHKVTYVKCVLKNQGYGRAAFYSLCYDGQEGSRELLLCFSWLLCRVKILEIILERNRIKVGDHVTICLNTPAFHAPVYMNQYIKLDIHQFVVCLKACLGSAADRERWSTEAILEALRGPQCHNQPFKEDKNTSLSTKREADIRYLQWLSGKLQICNRTLYAAHQEDCAFLYKIHSYTQGCHVDQTIDHLSVMETKLIQQPESCNKVLQSMESENSYLDAYMEWKHLESVYWRWMETVLQSAFEDEQVVCTPHHVNNKSTFFPSGFSPRNHLYNIQIINKDLQDVNDQLHELTLKKKLSWHEQSKEIERELSEKELCSTIKKIKQELKKKIEHVKCQQSQAKDMHGSFRIIFKERKVLKVPAHAERYVQATEAITFLQEAAGEMEAEYEKLQDQCRKRLDEMMERLEGVICIPSAKS